MTSNINPSERIRPIQMRTDIREFCKRAAATLRTRIIIVRYNNP